MYGLLLAKDLIRTVVVSGGETATGFAGGLIFYLEEMPSEGKEVLSFQGGEGEQGGSLSLLGGSSLISPGGSVLVSTGQVYTGLTGSIVMSTEGTGNDTTEISSSLINFSTGESNRGARGDIILSTGSKSNASPGLPF